MFLAILNYIKKCILGLGRMLFRWDILFERIERIGFIRVWIKAGGKSGVYENYNTGFWHTSSIYSSCLDVEYRYNSFICNC